MEDMGGPILVFKRRSRA